MSEKERFKTKTEKFEVKDGAKNDIDRFGLDRVGMHFLLESFVHNYVNIFALHVTVHGVTFYMKKHQFRTYKAHNLDAPSSNGTPINTDRMLDIMGINPHAIYLVAESYKKNAYPKRIHMVTDYAGKDMEIAIYPETRKYVQGDSIQKTSAEGPK